MVVELCREFGPDLARRAPQPLLLPWRGKQHAEAVGYDDDLVEEDPDEAR
jgi:hypothetical protein